MPDKRLIDANALANTFLQLHVETDPLDNDWFTPYLMVKDSETVDAVEVVRCRECVHAMVFRTGSVSCRYHDWCRINVDPDGYCNHGEKDIDVPTKDGGAEG